VTSFERAKVSPLFSPSLAIPASADQLPVLRATVRTVATQCRPSLDALADLVLAVNEAATILINHAGLSSVLVCVFANVAEPTRLRITLSANITLPIDASISSFEWFVLKALVDHVGLDQKPGTSGGGELSATIIMEKALQTGP